jgi:hypothetical protein
VTGVCVVKTSGNLQVEFFSISTSTKNTCGSEIHKTNVIRPFPGYSHSRAKLEQRALPIHHGALVLRRGMTTGVYVFIPIY